jgi:hypothetical protein
VETSGLATDFTEDDRHRRALKNNILCAVLGGLSVVCFEWLRSTIDQWRSHGLSYVVAAFDAQTNTRYIPVIGYRFARRHLHYHAITLLNTGPEPEAQVRLCIESRAPFHLVSASPGWSARDASGRPISDWSCFEDLKSIDVVIDSIPTDSGLTCLFMTYPEDDPAPPTVTLHSSRSQGARAATNPAWTTGVKDALLKMLSQADSAATVQALDWP